MTRQITKAFTAFGLFAALALFAAAGAARAQSPVNIKVSVPFDFYVGDRLLPAGEYTVRRAGAGAGNLLVVAGAGERAARQTNAVEGASADATRLVFHRYGGQYFLARLWVAGDREGREFRPSKRERAIRAEAAQIAALGGNAEGMKPVVVEVAAGQ